MINKKKIFNKNLIIGLSICLLITTLGLFSYFSSSINVGHDLVFHLNRIIGLSKAFEEGQILPKIYPYSNNGFGYASPLFYCDIFLYPFAIMYHFGLSAVLCFKLCVFIYTLLGNLFVYFIINKETKRIDLSIIAATLYFTCNYHLQNIFIRSALGEVLAMSFIPLILHSIYKILIKKENCWIYLGISFSLLVMAHPITTFIYGLFFFVMIIIFIILNRKDKTIIFNTFKTILKGTLLAILLTAWYLIPMLEQFSSQQFLVNIDSKYTNITAKIGILNISDILYLFGYDFIPSTGLTILLLGLVSIFMKDKYIKIIDIYCIVMFLMMLGIIPMKYLEVVQFYFRLYIIIFPLLCVSSICLLNKLNNKKIVNCLVVILLCFGLASIVTINIGALKDDDKRLDNIASQDTINNTYKSDVYYNLNELSGGEYLPYTEKSDYNNDSLAIKNDDEYGRLYDYIYEYDRDFTCITFTCDNSKAINLYLPLSWYKGYKGYELINGKWEEINIYQDSIYKEIMIKSEVGKHTYMVKYVGTFVQYSSLVVSSVATVCLILYQIKKRKNIGIV